MHPGAVGNASSTAPNATSRSAAGDRGGRGGASGRSLGERLVPWLLAVTALLVIGALGGLTLEVSRLKSLVEDGARSVAQRAAFEPGDPVPAVGLVSVPAGDAVDLGERLRAGPTLVYFFTTTCRFCAASTPRVSELRALLAGVADTIGVALNGPVAAEGYLELTAVEWPVLAPPDNATAAMIGVRTVPTLVLVGSDARVLRLWGGQVGPAMVDEIVSVATAAEGARR